MTARVTTLKGPDAGAYYLDALPRYYLDAVGEPPGRWLGHGADALGLGAELDGDAFLRIMAGGHPDTGVDLGRAYEDRSVRGFDVTASAPKSVSVLWALGDDGVRATVLTAHDTAVATMVDWIERHAHTRYRINRVVSVVEADGIVAGVFRQHTSRALDPQLHSHVVVANRVLADDGRWLALDARTLKVDQRTLSALYHASLRTELTARLGVEWEVPVNGIAEIAGIDREVLVEFSARTNQVTARVDVKVARFAESMGRPPTPRERWRLEREAVTDSRPSKSRIEANDAERLHTEWATRARVLGIDPGRLIESATDTIEPTQLTPEVLARIASDAMASLEATQSSWRPAELVRELAAAVPTTIDLDAADLVEILDLTAEKLLRDHCVELSAPIPHGTRLRRDGRPVTEAAIDRALTTQRILTEERLLLDWAQHREPSTIPARPISTPEHLSGPQQAVAAAIAGDRQLVLVIGPAGTGKTTAIKPGVEHLHEQGRTVFGVAPSAVAADVLGTETGVDADTIDKLLYEHRGPRRPRHRFDLPAGATVIVDEAAMVATPKLAELAALADAKAWRVVMVGDPMQFSAVGRSGMYALLCDTHAVIELDTVHRFAHPWERDASLLLRRSDPTALAHYDAHGRIHGLDPDTAIGHAIDAWVDARERGGAVLLMAGTTDTVVALNQAAQQRLIDTGELPLTRGLDIGDYTLHVGDRIVTRRNDRQLTTTHGRSIHNRDEWTITGIGRRGTLTIDGPNGRAVLPRGYVDEHVELAYAQTSHAAQGRTVDHALLYIDGPTDTAGLYVPLTRGRESNHAYVVTHDNETALDVLETALAQRWIDRPAHARHAELNPTPDPVNRLEPLGQNELVELLERRHRLGRALNDEQRPLTELPRRINQLTHDHDQLTGTIDRLTADVERARHVLAEHDRPFHRRRHTTEITRANATIDHAVAHGPDLELQRNATAEQLTATQQRLVAAQARQPERDTLQVDLDHTREALARDLDNRARTLRQHPDQQIIRFGPRPEHPAHARLWDHAIALHHRHRTAFATPDHGLDILELEHRRLARHAHDRLDRALEQTRELRPERTIDHGIEL